MHVPPGQWWTTSRTGYWKEEYLNAYLDLFAQYQDKIIMLIGAHAHPGEIRAPVSSRHPDLELIIMMTPCLAPYSFFQPGYTVIDIKPTKINAEWRFLQLQDYILFRFINFNTIDINKEFNINLASATSVRAFTQTIAEDKREYTRYLFKKMGYSDL